MARKTIAALELELEGLKAQVADLQGRLSRKGKAGPKPSGRVPLTNAERQRRKRAKAKAQLDRPFELP